MPKTQSKGPTSTVANRANRTYLNPDKSFDSDDHRVRTQQMFNPCFAETCRAHPFRAVLSCVIKTTRRLDQHIQTHQKTKSVCSTLVIDKRLENDQCSALGERFISLVNQHAFLVEIPVMEYVTHRDYVRGWKGPFEEIPALEL